MAQRYIDPGARKQQTIRRPLVPVHYVPGPLRQKQTRNLPFCRCAAQMDLWVITNRAC